MAEERMMEERLTALRTKISEITGDMAASAAAGDWGTTHDLGDLRLNLLEALIAGVDDPREEVALIEQILSSDRKLKTLAVKCRAEVVVELNAHQRRGEAARSYLDAASTDC